MPSVLPAASTDLTARLWDGVVGFQITRTRRRGHDLLEYLQLLRRKLGEKHREPRYVPARMREACDIAQANGVGVAGKHDRDRGGRPASRRNEGGDRSKNNVHFHPGELGGDIRQIIDSLRPPEFDADVFTLDVAQLSQPGAQGLDPARESRGRSQSEKSDSCEPCRLLRPRDERPGNRRRRRAAEHRDDRAPVHSITSSAVRHT
jgi:hypothetical protein